MSKVERAIQALVNDDLLPYREAHRADLYEKFRRQREADVNTLVKAGLINPHDYPPDVDTEEEALWKEGHSTIGYDDEGYMLMRVDSRPTHPVRAQRLAYKILAAAESASLFHTQYFNPE